MASIVAEVEFHSNKNCFVLLDTNALATDEPDELKYFQLRRCDDQSDESIYVAGHCLRSHQRRSDSKSRLILNGVFANRLGLKRGDLVLVSLISEPTTCLAAVAEPASSEDWEVVQINAEKIEEQLLVQCCVVFKGMEFPVWIDGGFCIFLRLVSCESIGTSCALLVPDTEITVAPKVTTRTERQAQIASSDQPTSSNITDDDQADQPSLQLRGIKFFDSMLDKLLVHAAITLSASDPIFIGHPVIVGSAGTGKTMLVKSICAEMKTRKLVASTYFMECKLLKGKAVESVEKRLKDKISNAINAQPAVIVLDDLDCLCSSCSTMEQITPGISILYDRMSRMLSNLIKNIHHQHQRILFLATSTSKKTLNSMLVSPRGLRYFDFIVEIQEPDLDARKAILERLISHGLELDQSVKSAKSIFTWVAKQTESHVLADLMALAERALIDFESEDSNREVQFPSVTNFKSALDGFVPISLAGADTRTQTQKNLGISFHDIGGLVEAKAVLEKVLLLPTKHPRVFATLPIRLPRGILLYGPSGCGKTLLAAAVAKDYKLNLIHIKGAELLSKYIGASEQGVRDTFARAKAMKPCLLFFDEFDALAPRRGHDSTGVTDRVVNQLLTEMDGVESLEGVFVLTASSRPDLIDPALLRPGRIDKRVYCGIPSEADRYDILNKQSKPLTLDADVDLVQIAAQTDGFSGADLKTILLDSHLSALREATTELMAADSIETIGQVRITHRHLSHVLSSMKPSVSIQERQRFEKMYDTFRGDPDEQAVMKMYEDTVGKRATLA